jgi:hypothetical protein
MRVYQFRHLGTHYGSSYIRIYSLRFLKKLPYPVKLSFPIYFGKARTLRGRLKRCVAVASAFIGLAQISSPAWRRWRLAWRWQAVLQYFTVSHTFRHALRQTIGFWQCSQIFSGRWGLLWAMMPLL